MEKRAARRHPINTTIVCRRLSTSNSNVFFDGVMKNCSIDGLYAELATGFEAGTFLVVRVTGDSSGYSKEEGFQSLAVAEVKWSKLISTDKQAKYAIGLKYVMT